MSVAEIKRADAVDENFKVERRVTVDDKMMINCRADLNQLVPFKYKWAWEKYLVGCANHWMPNEVNMTSDIDLSIKRWSDRSERIIVNVTFFATALSLAITLSGNL